MGLFCSNTNKWGFENKLVLSNQKALTHFNNSKTQICFLNYDLKNKIEVFKPKQNSPIQFPEQLFIEAEEIITFDLSINNPERFWFNLFDNPKSSEMLQQVQHDKENKIEIKPTITKEEYLAKVAALKQHIQQGDIYEINYCITFEAKDAEIDPIHVFNKLNAISKASYAALVKLDKQWIISSSPELFLSKHNNKLFTKPIKGTAKRGKTFEEDEQLKQLLQNSLKEQTENVMIVDVARNDLSRIATKGSVKVDKLFDIETYEQVHQMVSTVSCELKQDITFNDIIHATFPMASMTGAPKIKAMELIDTYELYNRGAYSGAVGYINSNGDFDLNVLIRSIFYDEEKKYLSFSVGSAITAMCNPEEEYEECLLKAKAMMQVLNEL